MKVNNEELIVLLDENYNEIDVAPKLASHHRYTPLHKAFSCYIFDDQGRFLVTQRALTKKVWPGVWTNSVCGHPTPGESFEAAIERRTKDELGMVVSDVICILPTYRYHTPPYEGIVENEFCPVYAARLVAASQINPEEVEALKWITWDEYSEELSSKPDDYSYWAKDQFKQIKQNATILIYSHTQAA